MLRPPRSDFSRSIYPVSRLDEYLKYLSGETYSGEEYTEREFIHNMTVRAETPKMLAGTIVHGIVEHAAFGELPEHIERDGWKIHFKLDATLSLPAIREARLWYKHKHITVVGRCDAIDALTVHDIKTTGSSIDADKFLDSFQWRTYLLASGRERFVYDVLKVDVDEDEKSVTVRDYVPIKTSAYPDMRRDVEDLLERFDACVKALGIPEIMARRTA